MTCITPEQRRELERAGDEPIRVDDPGTRREYVILRAEVYERLRRLIEVEGPDPSFFEIDDFEPVDEDPR